jgi:hypothetical protein
MPAILATQKAKIRRITISNQPWQIVLKSLSQKKKKSQKRASGVAQGVGLEFKLWYTKNKNQKSPEDFY